MIKRRLRPGDPRQATGVPALVEHGLGCPLFLSDVMLTTLFSLVLHRKERAVTGSFTGLYLYRFEGGKNDSIVFRNQKKNDSIYKK
jgi:hypothetical protein